MQSVGPIKRVEISYGPNSQSRGIANVIFNKPDGASLAFQKLNGLLVDNRPIKVCLFTLFVCTEWRSILTVIID